MGRWERKDVPHKGWICVDYYDLHANGEVGYATCEMCNNERIRYIHIMRHESYAKELKVGCICAEKMADDYVGPKSREKLLKNRSIRRKNWLKRNWRQSSRGNDYLNVDGHNVTIFPDKNRAEHWKFKIDDDFSLKSYVEKNQAKIAAFDALMKKRE
ncbi:MAG: hypothetical protein PHS66_02070 [Candidatus Omnitrophica bacterium]|nr:hypothetical protein [Candidatus Omnitrophota bacterium]